MKKVTVILILLLSVSVLAQDVIIDLNDDGDIVIFGARANRKPLVELSYSINSLNQEDFVGTIKKNGEIQLHLGYTVNTDTKSKKIYEEYFFFGYSNSNMNLGSNDGYYEFSLYKIGSLSRIGYAIPISGKIDFLPFYAGGLYLYDMSDKSNYVRPAYYTQGTNDNETIIKRTADEKFHLGNAFESGVRLRFNETFTVFGSYGAYVYYPRFMTWKFLGSIITYQIGFTLLDNFDKIIIRRSPVLGAITDVILKSAYNFVFYYFQKEDMNWPFATETPFTSEGVTLGFSINF